MRTAASWFTALSLLLFLTSARPAAPVVAPEELNWTRFPSIPDPVGFAGSFAGVSGGALLVAGGANFPGARPWEGGEKVWHDWIFVLPKPFGKWQIAGHLPHKLAYGVSITTTEGILCVGGCNSQRCFSDVCLMRWRNGHAECRNLPALPQPTANACGALVGHKVYIAGGQSKLDATEATAKFWMLDLKHVNRGWEELEPWPGPARILAVAGVYRGDFFLFSGAELHSGPNGKAARQYLTDAYRFTPGKGWKVLSALPRAAVAAPSPAIVRNRELLVVSGDDGELVNFEPKAKHPGFPRDVLAYTPRDDSWRRMGEPALSRATAPVVQWHDWWVIVNGEVRPGERTPEVWGLNER